MSSGVKYAVKLCGEGITEVVDAPAFMLADIGLGVKSSKSSILVIPIKYHAHNCLQVLVYK